MRIANIQLNSQNCLDDNLVIIKNALADATNQGARLVVLPENACLMGRQADIANQFDDLSRHFANLAKEHNIHLVSGTLPCPYDKDGKPCKEKFFQTSLLFDNQGRQIARYDKIHLFRAIVADGIGAYDEGQTFLAGDMPVIAPCVIDGTTVNIGMMICFDLRFPRFSQLLRQMGADILVAPSAFTYVTGQVYWQMLLQARAIDSQCLVVGSAQGGSHKTHSSERTTWGHSMIVGADGQVLASTHQTHAGDYAIVLADFNGQAQRQIRQDLPIFACHRLA